MLERIAVGAFAANCWIIPLAAPTAAGKVAKGEVEDCILVDPGAEAEKILSFLDARGLVPRLIVCTHGHLDHVCAIAPLQKTFEDRGRRIPIAIHREDAAYLGAGGRERNRRLFQDMGASSFFDSLWTEVPEADILLDDGATLADTRWRVIHTPGHSKGSICLYDEGAGLLISGDTLFRDGVGRTDGFDGSMAEIRESIAWKLFSLPSQTQVFPGHGEPTTIGRERGD